MITQVGRINRYALFVSIFWTAVIACAFGWLYYQQWNNALNVARAEARATFEKDTLYRKWAAGHGGLYVPATDLTPPSPYLAHIPERDIRTPAGRLLTLINPAYMTRQVFQLADQEKSLIRGHITSLKPLNSANKPDPWEEQALRAFERGEGEISGLQTMDGRRHMRLIRPFVVEERCLKCHAFQGYAVGEVRGGVSVSVPLAEYSGFTGRFVAGGAAAHGFIWLLGLGMIEAGRRALSRSAFELQKSEERYRTVADHTADWEYWLTPDDRFEYVSPSCRNVCGYTQEEFYRDPSLLERIIHPASWQRYNEHRHAESEAGYPEPIDFPIITRDGRERWISHVCRTVYGQDGAVIGRRVSNRDITDRKQAEDLLQEQTVQLEQEVTERQAAQESLQEQTVILEEEIAERINAEEAIRQSEEKFFRAFQLAPLMMTISDIEDGAFLEVNDKFVELSGYSREEAVGATSVALGLITAGDRARFLEALTREGRVSEFVLKVRTKEGRVLNCSYFGELIPVSGSTRLLSIVLDVTEHTQLEEQLRHSQKLEAVGRLAGGIAHDFNNILTVIMGCGNILKMDGALADRQNEMLGQIIRSAERAAQLTRGLLAFSRRQVIKPQNVDLDEIVRNVQKLLVRIIGEDIQLKSIFNGAGLTVSVDSGQIEQVLINMVANARDAMPRGGVITIETSRERVDTPFVMSQDNAQPGRYAVISVSDTGTGMDEETVKRLFEPFFTTKDVGKGTGLGMAIAYGIIKQHNGFVTVASEVGKGSTLKVYLPLVDEKSVALDADSAPACPRGGTETILVAEDDEGVRDTVNATLGRFGYDVILAVDGEDAVAKFAARQDQIRLVIMDMIMPKMSGKLAYEEIRKLQSGVRVLFFSGYTTDFIRKRGDLDDGVELLNKPVAPLELATKVRELLDGVQRPS
ncbi:PAS domain S-box protein [Geobacter sulfurreducens]|uniref:PAS domain S-box protein n=1 Tax=Geobacter sulfurreducens TaxID=35554 RepID=UPI000DBB23E2|nr:PAS domain S-box protein [Geobacter sulfurreducens]BBA69371.1 Blue-light-activated protein [Geobacter sulfurreducens]